MLEGTATGRPWRAYGIDLSCAFAAPETVRSLWSGTVGEPLHESLVGDGSRLRVERGAGGDHRVLYDSFELHLSPDLAVLTCAPPPEPSAAWERALLDWAPYAAAVLAGRHCLHASAVGLEAGVVAFTAAAGGGKTTLAAELVARGATFFCDDVLALEPGDGRVLAHPGPPFASLDAGLAPLAQRIGRARGRIGEELWVKVERRASAPAPLAAVVLLERRAGGPAEPAIGPADFFALRGAAVGFAAGPDERERFAVLAALAGEAELLRLQASPAVPAERLAAAIAAHFEGAPER